ncbi:predicted protein [Postia placenta Mad-698-R]|uniref:Chromatin modification-related protein n=1 Tax=Postia placenta MAD-698-R-SB12 TaxID=670580 RepID=A0A1X6N870_9APHY|nr:hypothetical protein POSPLADRAFT_1044146 [Postia placenta MAD-698-R-SB12]EED78479.1 predicted protein [Postia placenta Mad-698-R]OSX64656.1 hypothetical protein POSPLADRAFT_1044146 [Postia placenta MAD-698-R-SB12]
MSNRKSRKRRRTEAFQDEGQDEAVQSISLETGPADASAEQQEPLSVEIDNQQDKTDVAEQECVDAVEVISDPERIQKEQEIWDVIREEQYAVLEQLPLSLHRSFTLMQELDQQVHRHEEQLQAGLRQYSIMRKELARIVNSVPDTQAVESNDEEKTNVAQPGPEDSSLAREDHTLLPDAQPGENGHAEQAPENASPGRAASSVHSEPEPAQSRGSSRRLLVQVGQLADEVERAANEKVNVARYAHDLIDRYIRDLDRAIKEQETSISLGLRPGAYPASIMLPEVVAPSGLRARVVPEPLAEEPVVEAPAAPEEAAAAAADTGETTLGIVSEEAAAPTHGSPVRPQRRRRRPPRITMKKKVPKLLDLIEFVPVDMEVPSGGSGLKLTVPPLAAVIAANDPPIDPNEERWCFCNQVSFGVMVACDNENCTLQWFHLGCVGLTEAPADDEKWYCRDCAPLMVASSPKLRMHRVLISVPFNLSTYSSYDLLEGRHASGAASQDAEESTFEMLYIAEDRPTQTSRILCVFEYLPCSMILRLSYQTGRVSPPWFDDALKWLGMPANTLFKTLSTLWGGTCLMLCSGNSRSSGISFPDPSTAGVILNA